MKPKLRPNIDYTLITFSYLANLVEKRPEIISDFLVKNELTFGKTAEYQLELISSISEMLKSIIDIPDYRFSELLTADEYSSKVEDSIAFIKANYLDATKNGLTDTEKNYILNSLKLFYTDPEYNVIPFFNHYTATKYDRIAYSMLTSSVIFYKIAALISTISQENTQKEKFRQNSIDKNIDAITNTIITSKAEEAHFDASKTQLPELQLPNTITNAFDNKNQEQSGELKEDSTDIPSNPINNFFDFLKKWEKEMHLDNKALDSYYINSIHKRITELLPAISLHRRNIITGYIALDYGIIHLVDFKPATSSYNTLTSFLQNRVKGLIESC
jgi:hypothetical protein